jgi:hypothetical protein
MRDNHLVLLVLGQPYFHFCEFTKGLHRFSICEFMKGLHGFNTFHINVKVVVDFP